jgi:hypothetical protein
MGILSLLVEIYNLPNLKMNLKFDIEVSSDHGPFRMKFDFGLVLSLIRLSNRCVDHSFGQSLRLSLLLWLARIQLT